MVNSVANPHLAGRKYNNKFVNFWVAKLQPLLDRASCLEDKKREKGVKSPNEEMNILGWKPLAVMLVSYTVKHYETSADKGYRQAKKVCKELLTYYRNCGKQVGDREMDTWVSFNSHVNDLYAIYKEETRADYGLRVKQRKEKTKRIEVDLTKYLEQAHSTLTEASEGKLTKTAWKRVSASLALVTGRRMAEIHQTAIFKQIDDHLIEFSGRLKTAFSSSRETVYQIPTLVDAELCIAGLKWLESHGKRLDMEGDPMRVNAKYSKELSQEIKENWYVVPDEKWKEVETLEGKDVKDSKASMSYHKLRACYHVCCKANWRESGGDEDDYGEAARNWLADDKDASVNSYKRLSTVEGSLTRI